ncbi:MAG: transposase [Halofilum sp. (in: g-proteobacteria)]|nr:transposase [Halofilum sp. (in: g-proteobacteria)]
MPRRARIALPGVALHLVQRGINRQACFFCDGDRVRYLRWMGDCAAEVGCSVHAYVLMTNHVHLLVTPLTGDAAGAMMKRLGQRYVQT